MKVHAFEYTLKSIVGRSLPKGIGKILIESGFDTESSLATIDHNSVKSIEDFVNENRALLKDTVYENSIEDDLLFKFKPGHKSLIVSLPNALKVYESRNKIGDRTLNEEDLKQLLVKKITNFAAKSLLDLNFGVECIVEFQQLNGIYKCRFECPLCLKKIRCQYKKYWLISNLEKHIKNHYKIVAVYGEELEDESQIDSFEDESQSNGAEIVSYANQLELLDNILEN